MRKTCTIILLLLAATTFAQRTTNFRLKLISPMNNQYIPIGMPFTLSARIINQGPDSLRATDSIQLVMVWNGTPMMFINNNQAQPFALTQGYTIPPGDSATVSQQMMFGNATGPSSTFCVQAKPYNSSSPVNDPDTTDNMECITIQHQLSSLHNLLSQDVKVYPVPCRDELYFSNLPSQGATRVIIRDVTGRLLADQQTGSGMGTLRMDLHSLAPGQYFYQVFHEKATSSGSFLRQP